MGDTVGFQKTHSPLLPHLPLNGHVLTQQRARLGAVEAPGGLSSLDTQQPIERGRAGFLDQLLLTRQELAEMPLLVWQPERQRTGQSLAAHLLGR